MKRRARARERDEKQRRGRTGADGRRGKRRGGEIRRESSRPETLQHTAAESRRSEEK